MEFIFRALHPFIRWVVRNPLWVCALATVCSVFCVSVARNLTVDPDFAHLIPDSYPSVQALERIRATIGGGEVSVDLAVESPSFEANLRFAEALVPEVLMLRDARSGEPFFVRAELRRDTDFLSNNGLYFATEAELDQLQTYLEDQIFEAKLEANPLFFDLEDEDEEEEDAEDIRASYRNIIGPEYHLSPDSTILVVRFFTGGSTTDVRYIEALYHDMEDVISDVGPMQYHPLLSTSLAGRLRRHSIEVRAITDDVIASFGVGLLAVLLTFMSYFFFKAVTLRRGEGRRGKILWSELARSPLTALLIGAPLLMSLTWTAAVAYLAFGTLNLLSSTLGLVLFGLGIDYGIHFYARCVEERAGGLTMAQAVERTFLSTGQAIAVGALTTSAALYVLVVADFKGFSQFGFIAGTGVLFALFAMLVVLPALLTICERWGLIPAGDGARPPALSRRRYPAARGVLLGSVIAVAVALTQASGVEFEYRFGELEPEYAEWIAVNSKVASAFSDYDRRNPAYIVVDDPSQTQAVATAIRRKIETDTTRRIVEADTFWSAIRSVETLQERFPMTPEAQQEKLVRIAFIRDTLLADPLVEIRATEDLDLLHQAAQTRTPIEQEDVPDFLRRRFTSKSGELGGFVTIFPSVGLSDGRNSMAFAEDAGTVVTDDGGVYHAGSTSIVAADMLRLMQREAPYMVLATLVIVLLLMWVNFVKLRWALLALLPLVVGVLWMLLLMELLGLRLNFYNLVVIPAVIGIGNDAGAHIVHRYREEGAGSLWRVLRSTGEHVSVGALTTMVGFSGLLLSFHPGLNTIGALAIAGIGATLLAALLFLPALIQWLEDRRRLSFLT